MSTAYHMKGRPYLLVERDERPGGLARSEEIRGCTFDITGHWLHLRTDYAKALVRDLLGDAMAGIRRRALIFIHGRYVNYPFQSNLADLPRDVAAFCAREAVRAALGQASGEKKTINTFKDFALAHFGTGITREFIEPYNSKLWGVGIDQVTSAWCDRFVPVPDVLEIVEGAVRGQGQAAGYNAVFLYPRQGGIAALPRALYKRLSRDRIRLNTPLGTVRARAHQALIGSEWVEYDALVNTLPLPVFAGMIEDAGEALHRAAKDLRASRLVYAVGAVRGKPLIDGAHWVYLPGPETPIYRFGAPSNVWPSLAPAGVSSFYAEFTPGFDGDARAAEKEVKQLLALLGRNPEELDFLKLRHFPFGYVIFDPFRQQVMADLFGFFKKNGIFSIGRFGAWTYNAMEDAILDGRNTVNLITGDTHGD